MIARVRCAAIAAAAVALSACHVSGRLYDPVASGAGAARSAASIVRVGSDASHRFTDTFDQNCRPSDLSSLCMAFVEFDDMGELWDQKQVPAALNLIDDARKSGPPVVVTFIHGWKNNANDADDRSRTLQGQNANIIGFEGVLEDLKSHRYRDSPVVGVFIGWRGDYIPRYWPIRRQFSYFNRERTAIRLPGAALTSTLEAIASHTRAKVNTVPGAGTPIGGTAITIGHSFGGLILERALTQAAVEKVVDGGADLRELGDLVIFLNSAASASEGKQMLNFLKSADAHYTAADGRDVPLFVSISSVGDGATRFLMPIGHGLPFLGLLMEGSTRAYKDPQPPEITTDKPYYLATTAHMPVLQSHEVVEVTATNRGCAQPVGQFTLPVGGRRYDVCERAGRWNTTPYWVMEMPATIVPDHNGIFNRNFVELLLQFLPSSSEVTSQPRRLRMGKD